MTKLELFFKVLLNQDEFTALSILLADYQSGEINVDRFASNILYLIDEAEKVSNIKFHLFKKIP